MSLKHPLNSGSTLDQAVDIALCGIACLTEGGGDQNWSGVPFSAGALFHLGTRTLLISVLGWPIVTERSQTCSEMLIDLWRCLARHVTYLMCQIDFEFQISQKRKSVTNEASDVLVIVWNSGHQRLFFFNSGSTGDVFPVLISRFSSQLLTGSSVAFPLKGGWFSLGHC